MEIDIVFVKMDGTERVEIPEEGLSEKEQEACSRNLKKKFFKTLGYVPAERKKNADIAPE